jgi:acetyltransferase-like isoleucine patch superfamily enzyme
MHVVKVTERFLKLLRERHVYLSRQAGGRWRVGDSVGFADDCAVEPFTEILAGSMIPRAMGAFSYSVSGFAGLVRVGRYCSFAQDIAWMGGDHPMHWASTSPVFYDNQPPAIRAFRLNYGHDYEVSHPSFPDPTRTIGNDVWIGDQAMIAPGVTIGDGAVIGARALVRHDVPPYAVMAGHPARIIRYRFPEALVERFLAQAWWRYNPAVVATLPASEPERFLDSLAEKVSRENIQPMSPTRLTAKDLLAAATETPIDEQVVS